MGLCCHGGVSTVLLFLAAALCCISCVSAGSLCKVDLCSKQYALALDNKSTHRGSNYRYCTVLRNFADCIRAMDRSCRGVLEYHTLTSLVIQWNNSFNCSNVIAQGPKDNSGRSPKAKPRPSASTECNAYRLHRGASSSSTFSHCSLFGDPHLRTFYNELQTCRVLGAWPLIDNPYLAVQVTNDDVLKGSSATATSKVTVIIREHGPCAIEKTYEAQTDQLPGVFVDETKSSGPGVRIKEENPGKHVEIHLRYIGTRIIIRQVGRYLTFAIRMPQEIAIQGAQTETLELCLKGCPKRERIDFSQLLSEPDELISMVTGHGHVAIPKKEALATCKQYNVTDFYFDACVFDLLTTGDSTFSMAARDAMHDGLTLNPSLFSASQQNRTSFPSSGTHIQKDIVFAENSAPGRPTVVSVMLFLWIIYIAVNR